MNRPDAWPDPEARNGSVHVSGGTFNGPVAYGYQGHATQIARDVGGNQDVARLQQLLDELAVRVQELDGPAAADALDDLDRVQDELHRRRPDRSRMIELVSQVGAVIAPVSGLVELADHIKELIGLAVH